MTDVWSTWNTATSIYIDSASATDWTKGFYIWGEGITTTKEPKPESALEWLDRRVDEMRVAL